MFKYIIPQLFSHYFNLWHPFLINTLVLPIPWSWSWCLFRFFEHAIFTCALKNALTERSHDLKFNIPATQKGHNRIIIIKVSKLFHFPVSRISMRLYVIKHVLTRVPNTNYPRDIEMNWCMTALISLLTTSVQEVYIKSMMWIDLF